MRVPRMREGTKDPTDGMRVPRMREGTRDPADGMRVPRMREGTRDPADGMRVPRVREWKDSRTPVVTCRSDEYGEEYHRDWPTYGITIAEYPAIRRGLEGGDTAWAYERLDDFIDQTVLSSKRRWAVAGRRRR